MDVQGDGRYEARGGFSHQERAAGYQGSCGQFGGNHEQLHPLPYAVECGVCENRENRLYDVSGGRGQGLLGLPPRCAAWWKELIVGYAQCVGSLSRVARAGVAAKDAEEIMKMK